MLNIEYRPAKEADISQLVEAMNKQYARKKDDAYFKWQYFHSYQPAVTICAFFEDKLAGMFGLQKRILQNDIQVGQAVDLLIAPEWRGKGIFLKLGRIAVDYFDDLDVLCVLPNTNGKNACEKSLGWKTLARIDSLILNKKPVMNSIEQLQPLKNHFTPLCGFKYNMDIRKWRFEVHPDYKYTHISISPGIFAITKIFTDPLNGRKLGDIVDFECDINNISLLADLFIKASHFLLEQGVEGVTTWALPHTHLYQVLASLGFEEMPQERYFCVKVINPEYDYLYNITHWHLVQADAEIY